MIIGRYTEYFQSFNSIIAVLTGRNITYIIYIIINKLQKNKKYIVDNNMI